MSTIEDKGYEVVFHDGHVLMHSRGSNTTSEKVIGVCNGKLYRFMFKPTSIRETFRSKMGLLRKIIE